MANVEKLAPLIEKWKDVNGYEGIYMVSNYGNVCSVGRCFIRKNGRVLHRKGCKLSPCINKDGYRQVTLRKNGIGQTYRIASLVSEAFLCKKDGSEVDHINANRKDDRVENLRYVTHKENCNNLHFIENQKKRNLRMKSLKNKRVFQLDQFFGIIKEWISLSEACRILGMDPSTVSKACRNHRKTAYGFKWRYA